MFNTELEKFIKNYSSKKDYEKIKFDWNGKHGTHFKDVNHDFRIRICEQLKNNFSLSPDDLIIDLYLELSKSAKESFGVYNSFHLFANELLKRGGVKYLDTYIEGAKKSMDTGLASGRLNLENKRIFEILAYLKNQQKNSKNNFTDKGYDFMLERFTHIAKQNKIYNYDPEDLYRDLKPRLNCIDYTVSKEEYSLLFNKEFEMLVTQPVPENLEKYYESENYISHTDSKKTLFDRVYQIVKNYALKNKLKLINSFDTKEKTLLDIGAGTGDFISICRNNSWCVSGVEPSEKARDIALSKKIELQKNISDFENQKFDVITMWHVLEHVPNLIEYITKLKRLLKDDGVLIVAVPNFKSYDAKHYEQFWAAFDVPRHLWHFSKTSIIKLFRSIEMNVEKVLPMKFDSFYVSLLSEKYKSGKMKPLSAFYIGLLSNMEAKRTKEYSSLIYIIKKT